MKQRTLCHSLIASGREPYGGRHMDLTVDPLEENSGINFSTAYGAIPAHLDLASEYKGSILLDNGKVKVLNVEHLLATLYAYGIDNAMVHLHPQGPPPSSDITVIPHFERRQQSICEMITAIGLQEQGAERKLGSVGRKVGTEHLSFSPAEHEDISIEATTAYPQIGEQHCRWDGDSLTYATRVAPSRPLAKIPHWMEPLPRVVQDGLLNFYASSANSEFGSGHGYDRTNVFIPGRSASSWREEQQRNGYPATDELAWHTIIDRLGAIALLGYRLHGVDVRTKFSGHANDLKVLKEYLLPQLVTVKQPKVATISR